jgi:hypothetical protein
MCKSWSKQILLALLGHLAASRGASALPWTVKFGNCTFSGDDSNGASLMRSGSCPMKDGTLDLSSKRIKSVLPQAFAGMAKME